MWEIILSLPVLVIGAFIQIGVFGEIHLINGNTDIIMLIIIAWGLNDMTKYSWIWALLGGVIMTYVSALSFYGYIIIYLIIWLLIYFIKKRVWQMPIILMLFTTICGTLIECAVSFGTLYLRNPSITGSLSIAIERIAVPSLIMNLLLAVPVYAIFNDFANTIYYTELES